MQQPPGTTTRVVRRHLRVTGVVQGVGFRPFVHRLARELRLSGHVGNDAGGVFCEVEGPAEAVESLERRLVADAPPLARIDDVHATTRPPTGDAGFAIVASQPGAGGVALVSADLAPCEACLREMADPADRRFGYPLLNCTDCGPRFTITREVPYDRATTTMAAFPMCGACRREYDDPDDRRFHAQPTACPACGPAVWLERPAGVRLATGDPIGAAAELVTDGGILAVKGVGGWHLACVATDDDAVDALRARKHRPDKPLAVMVPDVATARLVAEVDDAEAALLEGPERPIVLLRRRDGGRLSPAIAPGNGFLGVMLPASPLHALLLPAAQVWVMTSGNVAGQPICTGDEEARERLGGIADALLGHDRPVHVPCDDSVVRVVPLPDVGGRSRASLMPIRRSRGYVPYPVPVALPAGPPVLALGGELKATCCLRREAHAFMGPHIGDMADLATISAFERSIDHMASLFRAPPEVLACDSHPGYASHRWAHEHADGRPVVEVQHHHAHLASLMAEHRIDGPISGFAFDGTGYGADGTIWGGEVLLADLRGFVRIGHLAPSLLAGGDAAVQRPYRQALARLREAGLGWTGDLPCVAVATEAERRTLATQLDRRLATVETTSMGRLLDALSSIAGVRHQVTYEGQAAIELEALVDPGAWADPSARGTPVAVGDRGAYHIEVDGDGVWQPSSLVRAVAADAAAGTPVGRIAAHIHTAVAEAIIEAAERARDEHGLDVVGLSGGVFANVVLTTAAVTGLHERGFTPLVHRLVPCNDGGLALGQVAVAAHAVR